MNSNSRTHWRRSKDGSAFLRVPLSLSGSITLREAIEEKRAYYEMNDHGGFMCQISEEFDYWNAVEHVDNNLRKFLKHGQYEKVGCEEIRGYGRRPVLRILASDLIKNVLGLDVYTLERIRGIFGGCEFSPLVERFLKISSNMSGYFTLTGAYLPHDAVLSNVRRMNEQLDKIRHELSEISVQRSDKNWLSAAKKNIRSARYFVNKLSLNNLQVIQLELGYKNPDPDRSLNTQGKLNASGLNENTVRADREKWVRKIKAKYRGEWIGCLWRIEYSPQRGYVIHVHVFLHARSGIGDVIDGMAMGQIWVDAINNGQGVYMCLNRIKGRVLENGIGYLSNDADTKRRLLWRSIGRRLLLDSVLRPDVIRGGRNFGHSQSKVERPAKRMTSLERYLEQTPDAKLRQSLKMKSLEQADPEDAASCKGPRSVVTRTIRVGPFASSADYIEPMNFSDGSDWG
ncbi:MAG: hypothetical protein K5880_02245 [Hydrogenophaga sp.]|uniref:hypothetical protein n=1 Tax=Hydrogenophaga sp. TaxID=1904254 RepID=UPI0026122691|nr:hypothetical protein [Hydrogenophaga sp.]MCV0437424.1 hypothetical protein [Hydrogenophaga sp.]